MKSSFFYSKYGYRYIYPIISISSLKLRTSFQHASLFGFLKKITHNNPIRKMKHFFQIHSMCTCARNMYILALAGCAPKETCEIALKMRECCQQSCKLCCKMTKMMAFNLDDYFPLCPFHVLSGIPVEFHVP